MKIPQFFSLIIMLILLFSCAAVSPLELCSYTLSVETGSFGNAGTNSKISVTLSDATGESVLIPDLEDWGLPLNNNFESGHRDTFTGTGPCTDSPICKITVSSDGSGSSPDWFCEEIQVISAGTEEAFSQRLFPIYRWFSTTNGLEATFDECG